MRNSSVRLGKYAKKIRGLVLPSQSPGYRASLPERIRLERIIKALGVTPMLAFSYLAYGEQLLKLKNTHKGETGADEARYIANHWLDRGLDSTLMLEVGSALGFSSLLPEAPTIREYYNLGDDNSHVVWGILWDAQSFTVGSAGPNQSFEITSLKLKMYIDNDPGLVTVSIRDVDGAGKPVLPDLSTGTIPGSSILPGAPGQFYEITMSSLVLQAGVKYALVVRAPGGDGTHRLILRLDMSAPTYAGGNFLFSNDGGGTWSNVAGWEMMFEVWGRPPWP